ncbi:MAG: YraN family protein [Deltaproteobacteria bacterium]|nr:YraN family protein [Deltaproteobacteria bacterium]
MTERSPDDRRRAVQRGAQAESWVARRLESEGWRILERNWRCDAGEIDLVAEREGVLRFVEVKARVPEDPTGLEAVDREKQRRVARAAETFLAVREGNWREVAFLVALVEPTPSGFAAQWVDDAFDA